MTDTQRKAMQMALEALVQADSRDGMYSYADEIAALSQALAEPVAKQSPVEKDAARYRWLRNLDREDFAFAVVKNPHFDIYESTQELDADIDSAMKESK